uniref:Protein regulator of cytokinesis 1 n=1 Tax=Meloidogyne incognita TaxID=6306 RepID=A0A914LNR4_MELIC
MFNSNMDTNTTNSMEQTKNSASDEFSSFIDKLEQLWDKVHMEEFMREERRQQISNFHRKLLSDLLTGEDKLVTEVGVHIVEYRNAVHGLNQLLCEPLFDESAYLPGSVSLLEALNVECKRLTKRRDQGFKVQKELFDTYELACKRLGEQPENVDGLNERFLSASELEALRIRVAELKRILNERLQKLFQYQSEAIKIYDIIHHASTPVLTEADQHYLKINLHSHDTVISTTLLDKLEALCQKLKDQHDSWLEQVAFRYDELLIQFSDISEKCFMSPAAKLSFENIDPSKLNESELKRLQEQIQDREELYKRAQPVFDLLREWMNNWRQKLEAERRVCRASFYKNRAGSLNQKLKQRKMLDMKLPKLMQELHAACDKYEEHYIVDDIMVSGLRADQYAEQVVSDYERERELLRVQKQLSNTKGPQTPGRIKNVFGTTTTTISAQSTPTRTTPVRPPAARKLIPKMPIAAFRPRKRSLSESQISFIHPIHASIAGPHTSSPKPEGDCS